MLDPKFVPYISGKIAKTEHGVAYSVLNHNAPDELKKEYELLIKEQDAMAAKGEPVFMF